MEGGQYGRKWDISFRRVQTEMQITRPKVAWSLGIKEIFTSVGMSERGRGGTGSGLGWVKKVEQQSRPRRHDQGSEGNQPGEGSVFESREEGSLLSSAARRSNHSRIEGCCHHWPW